MLEVEQKSVGTEKSKMDFSYPANLVLVRNHHAVLSARSAVLTCSYHAPRVCDRCIFICIPPT